MANRATSVFCGLALVSLAVLAAPSGCGGSNTGYNAFADSGPVATFDATNQGSSSGNTSSGSGSGSNGGSNGGGDDTGPVCPSSCSSDSDCQNSCPAVANGGVNCCDVMSSSCFSSPQSSCPVADAGTPE
ncbi:MAG: hypothetical protein ACRENE_07130 [Polyangiaceae bacterium]